MSDIERLSRNVLIREFAQLSESLREYGIRRLSDYAEILVAEAVDGVRVASGVNKGFDVIAPGFGRIEVKHRVLPADGRIEQRIQLSNSKLEGFDYLAIVLFDRNISVQGAVLIPYEAAWSIVESRKWRRLSYDEATTVVNSINITEQVATKSRR